MDTQTVEYQRTVLVGVAVEKRESVHGTAPKRWYCFVLPTNGENHLMPFISRVTFMLPNRKRMSIDAPGPYIIEGEGTVDFPLIIRLTSIDKKNVDFGVEENREALCSLMRPLIRQTGQRLVQGLYPFRSKMSCNVKDDLFSTRFFLHKLLIHHPSRKVRDALESTVGSDEIPYAYQSLFPLFVHTDPTSPEFFNVCESQQLGFLDSLIEAVDKAHRKLNLALGKHG
ncbi:response regulator/GGDEF domain protein [Perkinsela sp. CCAP 1560/4]|nr:response regulator/GGDEF domain protein [Perkinsela sp. CCAP 1560/4]|eukprot:KNH07372.1 response regulator/GGDEF domain protein [Perkinsela sp. CCAP 1560/4]